MKWKKHYECGDKRISRKFCWLPKIMGIEGIHGIKWLEYLYVKEEKHFTGWKFLKYVTKEEYEEAQRKTV
jgi:hypothetical protein